MKRMGLSAYLIPRKRSWLNPGRERPIKMVFGLLLFVDRVAVGGFDVVPVGLGESGLDITPGIIERHKVEISKVIINCIF